MQNTNQAIPRPEFPNPQFERKSWQNLNGKWQFKFDHGKTGEERDFVNKSDIFDMEINVPFTYESPLSGINIKDICECVWYKRTFNLSDNWNNGRILLHFGAVDYHAKVWINGKYVSFHRGGMTSFAFDITKYVQTGENTVVVKAFDDLRSGKQPSGKQNFAYYSFGCVYTRTTGIWQTVWLEYVPFESYIKDFKVYTDIDNSTVTINASFDKAVKDAYFAAKVLYNDKMIAVESQMASGTSASIKIDIPTKDLYLWDVGKGELYSLILKYGNKENENSNDKVYSYFGMRDVKIDGHKILINGKPVFQRLILDQGFYPDGTWTAPSAEALKNDILISMEAGFNGARLHQKIFEPLFLYYADSLGYITWGEHGNWGMDFSAESYQNFTCEWIESINRDFNHPSIVGWCPHNETHWGQRRDDLAYIYRITKAIDSTRPVIDTSGYVHVETDIFDIHDYEQNVEVFKNRYDALLDENNKAEIFQNDNRWDRAKIMEYPYFVSEFGGTWWSEVSSEANNDKQSWGYGKAPEDIENFYERFDGLVTALLDNPRICAFCYTQLTDVEQEQNGIVYYDRRKKFDMARLHKIMTKIAAIEK